MSIDLIQAIDIAKQYQNLIQQPGIRPLEAMRMLGIHPESELGELVKDRNAIDAYRRYSLLTRSCILVGV